jgi:NAD+ kinase
MVNDSMPQFVVFGDPAKGNVTDAINEFLDFSRGKAKLLASCGIEDCTVDTLSQADYAVVFGGDGSIISAARQISQCNVAVIGVNLGKLGYLAEFSIDELKQCFDEIIAGKAVIEKRMMLDCSVVREGKKVFSSTAVNEVFITAGPDFNMVELQISVDNAVIAGCVSDGLIISTPTGSTAYNLSAGGPILSGGMEAMVITPMCPHSLSFRPIVISADCKVRMVGLRINPGTTVSADGQQNNKLLVNDIVNVTRSKNHFLIVSNPARTNWQTLATKLGWAEKPKYNKNNANKTNKGPYIK